MKFIVSFLLMAAGSYAACIFFPWWSVAIIVFLIAVIIPQTPGKAFLCAFFSIFLLWAGLSYWISYNNDNLFARKLSLIIFNFESPIALIFLTGLIGGAVSGFAGLAGSYLRFKSS